MSDLLETLRKLQAVDAELYKLRQELRLKPQALERVKQAVAAQQANAKRAEEQLKGVQLKHKEKELELSSKESNVKRLQGQLFQVKTNKEYTAIQHEIDQAKADISMLEEEILGLMDQTERAKQTFTTEQTRLTAEQDTLKREQTRIEQDVTVLKERTATLEQQRKSITPSVQGESLSLYERILKSREGLAMVPLEHDSACGGCHMVQPPQVINEVFLKARLVTCDSCNRILYVSES